MIQDDRPAYGWIRHAVHTGDLFGKELPVPLAIVQFIENCCLRNDIQRNESMFPTTTRAIQKQLRIVCRNSFKRLQKRGTLPMTDGEKVHSIRMVRPGLSTPDERNEYEVNKIDLNKKISRLTSAAARNAKHDKGVWLISTT